MAVKAMAVGVEIIAHKLSISIRVPVAIRTVIVNRVTIPNFINSFVDHLAHDDLRNELHFTMYWCDKKNWFVTCK